MILNKRKVFGAYDCKATLSPSYDDALRYDVVMAEEDPMEDTSNRRFVGTLTCGNESVAKRAEYDAAELLQIEPRQHFLNFAKALESSWLEECRLPKRRGSLRIVQCIS